LKASFFDCKPTLDNLEKKFSLNQSAKLEFRQRMATDVQRQINLAPDDLADLDRRLTRERMRMAMQVDKEGKCKEVSYVSFVSKCVFSGDELGGRCDRHAVQKVLDLQRPGWISPSRCRQRVKSTDTGTGCIYDEGVTDQKKKVYYLKNLSV